MPSNEATNLATQSQPDCTAFHAAYCTSKCTAHDTTFSSAHIETFPNANIAAIESTIEFSFFATIW